MNTEAKKPLRLSGALYVITGCLISSVLIAIFDRNISPHQLELLGFILFVCVGTFLFMIKRLQKYVFVVFEMAIAIGLAALAFHDRLALGSAMEDLFSAAFIAIFLKAAGSLYAFAKALDTISKNIKEDLEKAEESKVDSEIKKWTDHKRRFDQLDFIAQESEISVK